VQVETARALWTIGGVTNLVLEILTNSLSPTGSTALNATLVLSEMGRAAETAVPILVRLLGDETGQTELRGNAAFALGSMGIISDDIVTALLSGLKATDSHVHGNCAVALWKLDTKYAQFVAPVVVKYAAVDLRWDSFVKFANRHHLNLKPAAPALGDLVQSESHEIRNAAAEALREIRESPPNE